MSSGLTNRLVAGLPPMMMMPPVTASNSSFRSTRAAWLFSIWLIGLSVWSLVSDCGPHVSVVRWLGRAHDLEVGRASCREWGGVGGGERGVRYRGWDIH